MGTQEKVYNQAYKLRRGTPDESLGHFRLHYNGQPHSSLGRLELTPIS